MKRSIKSSGVGDVAGRLLSADELERVSGGWCGTPVPGTFPIPVTGPDPTPWSPAIVDIANPATFDRTIISRTSMMRF